MIFLKSKRELKRLKASCQLTARILQEMGGMVRTGVTSLEINDYGGRRCHDEGVRPVFLNYPGSNGQPPFPGVICASPNSVVVHGIPDDVPLVEGDILSVDFGIKRDSYCGDTAYTFKVGQVSESTQHLLDVCEEALRLGIEQAVSVIAWGISHTRSKPVWNRTATVSSAPSLGTVSAATCTKTLRYPTTVMQAKETNFARA